MIRRFEGDAGRRLLAEALRRQQIVEGNVALAEELAAAVVVQEVKTGERLVAEDGADNDLYFIVCGRASVLVHGREVAVREAGTHVGEMAMIDPTARRCATVVALADMVVAKVTEPVFSNLAERSPRLWRLLALELASRLRARNRLVLAPNPRPVLFIGSSAESLTMARAVQSGLAHDDILVRTWTDGVFLPSHFTVDDLIEQVVTSDFAALVFAPDDRVISRHHASAAPRDNVLLELGLFMGSLGRERSVIVMPRDADIKIPSDLIGLTPITYVTGPAGDLPARIAPACNEIRQLISRLGCK